MKSYVNIMYGTLESLKGKFTKRDRSDVTMYRDIQQIA